MEYPKCARKMRTQRKIKKKDASNTGHEFPPRFLRISANYMQKVFACCYLSGAILCYLKVILKVNKKNHVVTFLVNFRWCDKINFRCWTK